VSQRIFHGKEMVVEGPSFMYKAPTEAWFVLGFCLPSIKDMYGPKSHQKHVEGKILSPPPKKKNPALNFL